MKRKLILSSIMTIVLALSLIAGSTLALFTSQSQVNISVGSAKVSLLSIIEKSSLELYSLDVRQDVRFENGGTAELTDASHLVLENVTPGDKAVFDIVLTNESTVDIQYRIAWSIKGTLSCGLVATADGKKIVNSQSDWQLWETPLTVEESTRKISVSVELPVEAGNEFQESSADITFTILAVQGNGTEIYVPACDVLATPDTIDAILAEVAPGTVIGLQKGKYGSIKLTQNNLSLVSENAVVDFIDVNAKDNCKISGITFDAAAAKEVSGYQKVQKVLTFGPIGAYANIIGAGEIANGADNLIIENCTFTGTPVDATKYRPICFYERYRNSGGMKGATVTGCTFETDAEYYVYFNTPGQGLVTISDNTFGTYKTKASNAVYVGLTQGDVKVCGNTFMNSSATITPHNNDKCTYALDIFVVKNNFVNTTDSDLTAFALRNFHELPKCTVTVRANTANYGYSKIKAPYEDSASYMRYDVSSAGFKFAYDDETLAQGGTLLVIEDIELTEKATEITKDTKLLLNGYTISAYRNHVDGAGLTTPEVSTLCVKNGVTLEIEGEGSVINTAPSGAYAISITEDSEVIIKGGNYISYHDAIYVYDGELYVEGGFFKAEALTSPEFNYPESNPTMYLATVINCQKNAFLYGSAKVTVTGGTFVNEDLSNLYEGLSNTSFVADGYKVISEAQPSGEVWFTVIPE